MNSHKNARLTPFGRAIMVQRILKEGWTAAAAAAAAAVSERTAYTWLARYRAEGEAGLQNRSSAPHRCPHRTSDKRVAQVERLRRRRLASTTIATQLAMPLSTVTVVLRRLGLARLSNLDPKPPIVRYERARPGELIHIDIKKLGSIRGVGHRMTGTRKHRNRGIGWDFLHVCVDDASRLAYTEMLPDEGKASATGFLERALAWLKRNGVNVERVMTDNGSAYLSKDFRATCQAAGLRHVRTKPYTPRTNGKAERFIQSALREWAYARPYRSSLERARAAQPWTDHYNLQRPHWALGRKPPAERLNNLLGNDT